MTKSYNPFKMWGSHIGGTIGLLLGLVGVTLGRFGIDAPSNPANWNIIVKIIMFPSYVTYKLFYWFATTFYPHQCNSTTGFCIANKVQMDIINISPLFEVIISLIVFFLIGWGIHSLIRKLR